MHSESLIYLTADEAIKQFSAGSISPVDLIQAIIMRSETVEPHINAFTETYFDKALAEAKNAETRYRQGRARPLEGIALAVKDEFRLKGTRRTSSSLVYRDRIDDETDVIIQRLLDAGAIVHAKTTTPEFCLLGSCHSRLWGTSHNPWNLDISPGGSSGGSGAALAAGTATIATGTDIGGSIRIPAALCGVVGYKPPYGRNPELPIFNLDFYSHSGPMARSVADIAMMQNIISGPHNQDIASLREIITLDYANVDNLTGWKIAYSMDLGFLTIDHRVRRNTEQALEVFQELGANVEQVELGWDESIIEAAHHYWAHGWAVTFADLLVSHRDELTDYAVWFLENALSSTSTDYLNSIETTVQMYNQFGPLMDEYDIFICPTLTTSSVPAEFTWPESNVEVNGQLISMDEEHWNLTYVFNMLSRCPAISLPSGVCDNGVPTAIQIVGRSFDDQRVITVARAFEQAFRMPDLKLDPRIV